MGRNRPVAYRPGAGMCTGPHAGSIIDTRIQHSPPARKLITHSMHSVPPRCAQQAKYAPPSCTGAMSANADNGSASSPAYHGLVAPDVLRARHHAHSKHAHRLLRQAYVVARALACSAYRQSICMHVCMCVYVCVCVLKAAPFTPSTPRGSTVTRVHVLVCTHTCQYACAYACVCVCTKILLLRCIADGKTCPYDQVLQQGAARE